MNIQQSDLYQRLKEFQLDELEANFPFSYRLAKENGWSVNYTHRVIEEYKKFAFLAVQAGHPVSPSEAVDQVWHLHLTYTQSYWGEFCPQVLKMPLHHQPTRGGQQEQQKFHNWYTKTLESYQQFFGSPPTDIWTPPDLHLRHKKPLQWIDPEKNWIIPKPSLDKLPRLSPTQLALIPLFLGLNLMIAGCQMISNPLNYRGPKFLVLYSLILIVTLFFSLILRCFLRKPSYSSSTKDISLEPYEIAYLVGGKKQAVDTAITSLVQREYISLTGTHPPFQVNHALPEDSDSLEQSIVQQIEQNKNIALIRSSASSATEFIRDRLQELKLVVDNSQAFSAQLIPTLPIFAVLLFGISKIIVGAMRDKPVGWLVVLCLITVGIGFCFLSTPVYRSRYGDRLFFHLKKQHNHLNKSPEDSQLLLAFALFGTTVLNQESWTDLYQLFISSTRSSSRSSSGGGCSNYSSCGGGSSCGSSCGGGCGGCGGCGGD